MSRRLAALALAAFALAGCVRAAPTARPGTEGVAATVEKWRLRAGVPAVVAMVGRPGEEPVTVAAGTLERGGDGPVTADSLFRAASITKTLVAVVVLQLAEEGKLSLDDPAAGHLPGDPYRSLVKGVSIRDLLAHTSGVPDVGRSSELTTALVDEPGRRWTTEEVLALAEGKDAEFRPGTSYGYSNSNYLLLGEVIRSVTGRSWHSDVRERVLDPAGMTSSYLAGLEEPTGVLIPGYFDLDNDGDTEEVPQPWPALESAEGPAGGLVSTAPDLLRFLSALAGGELVPRPALDQMTQPGRFASRYSGYGLGVEIRHPDLQTLVWGHGGFLPGFRSVAWHVPSQNMNIVVLSNESRSRPDGLAELLLGRLGAPAHGS